MRDLGCLFGRGGAVERLTRQFGHDHEGALQGRVEVLNVEDGRHPDADARKALHDLSIDIQMVDSAFGQAQVED